MSKKEKKELLISWLSAKYDIEIEEEAEALYYLYSRYVGFSLLKIDDDGMTRFKNCFVVERGRGINIV